MADAEGYLRRVHQGPVRITRLGEQISGMVVDRETLRQAEDLVAAGQVDLILTEDIGRVFRNPRHMYAFVQDCVDAEVRLIAVADNIDTADDNWETALSIAAVRHGFAVPDASRRTRRSAVFSFRKGGNVQKIKFGFRKLSREESLSGEFVPVGLRIAKIEKLTDTIKQICAKVKDIENFRSYDDIADWLNESGVAPGPYSRNGKWTGTLVATLVQDDALAGFRAFKKVSHVRIFSTGKYKRQRNAVPEKIHYPVLAHLTVAEFEDVQQAVRERAKYLNHKRGREHPRYGVPRHKAIFPAQHMQCCACEQNYYPCARGSFKCQRSFKHRENRCWNHVQVDVQLARCLVIPWVLDRLSEFPNFRNTAIDVAWEEITRLQSKGHESVSVLDKQIAALEREQAPLAMAIRKGGDLDILVTSITEVTQELTKSSLKRENARKSWGTTTMYPTRDDVAACLTDAVMYLAGASFKLADWLRSILTRFEIVPVQAIDSGLVRPRAYLTLAVTAPDESGNACTKEIEGKIDLFEPPIHIRFLTACVEARKLAPGQKRPLSYDKIARQLGINRMTVKRALALAGQMALEGLTEPYRELREPPLHASRWRIA